MYCNLQIAKEILVLITDKEEYSVSCILLYIAFCTSAILQGIHDEITKTSCKIYVARDADTEYFILYLPRSVIKLILITYAKESKSKNQEALLKICRFLFSSSVFLTLKLLLGMSSELDTSCFPTSLKIKVGAACSWGCLPSHTV